MQALLQDTISAPMMALSLEDDSDPGPLDTSQIKQNASTYISVSMTFVICSAFRRLCG